MIRKIALQLGVAALAALIGWNAYVVVSHVKHMRRIAALTVQSSGINAEASAVLKDLMDMEAGQRGYLITSNPSYLHSYTEANGRIAADFASLRGALTNGSERERSQELQVESTVNSKQSEMEHSLALRKQGYRHLAFKLVNSSEGMEYLDNAREQVSSLLVAENSTLASMEAERNAALDKILKETVTVNLALLGLAAGLFVLVRHHGQVLEQEAAQSKGQLALQTLQLAKLKAALCNEAWSKTSAIEANAHLLLQEYGGFLPRHAHACAEQIEEASTQLEQLRQDLVGDSCPRNVEEAYEAVA